MRNLGLILIAALILAGAAAYLLWGPRQDLWTVLTPAKQPSVAPKSTPEPVAKEEEPRRARSSPKRTQQEPLNGDVPSPPPPPPPPPAVEQPSPFPNSDQIQAGTERSRLLASFGKPIMKTTAVDHDRLLETFVYLNAERNTATFVLLQNGRVVSAQTSIY